MKRNSQLSNVLHVLLHLDAQAGPVTSEVLARALDTNPVVIRRVMASRRECGYVASEKGHGGGWLLSCDLATVTVRDVYNALGCAPLLALGNRTEAPGCVVEQAVNAALGKAFDDAEALIMARFDEVTLSTLATDARVRRHERGICEARRAV